ncbi:hypothetical protein E4U37_002160 [Claviceps purpurea]|nr:hypothetical protein E4U37_002160 [Claviceps purpurea]
MKFFSPFFIFVFGALVTPIIGHAVPNVEGGVDVVERDVAGAPAHLFARKKPDNGFKTDLVRVVVQEIAESVYIEDSS